MPAIGRITIGGLEVPLERVLADVTIRHGRGSFNDGPTASSADLLLYGFPREELDSIDIAYPVRVELEDGTPAFVGSVTDAGWSRPNPDALAELHVIATGRLATLGSVRVGYTAWPVESWTERVVRILTESGYPRPDDPPPEGIIAFNLSQLDSFDGAAGTPINETTPEWIATEMGSGAAWAPYMPRADGAGACSAAVGGPAGAQIGVGTTDAQHGPRDGFGVQFGADCAGATVSLADPTGARYELTITDPAAGSYVLDYVAEDGTRTLLKQGSATLLDSFGLVLLSRRIEAWTFQADAPWIQTVLAGVDNIGTGLTYGAFTLGAGGALDQRAMTAWELLPVVSASLEQFGAGPIIETADYVIMPPAPDPPMAARAAPPEQELETIATLDALTIVVTTTGGGLFDMPDGRLLVQALPAREGLPQLDAPPELVVYAPEWLKTSELVNRQTVSYRYAYGTVSAEDDASIGRYGPHEAAAFETGYEAGSDAQTRVDELVEARAWPRWHLPACNLLERLELLPGYALHLTTLPDDAPLEEWTPIVEGWAEHFDGESWTMTVALSDRALSGLPPPPVVPVNITQPFITGAPLVGSLLTCDPGTWEGPPTSYSYQWIVNAEWVGETGSPTYVPTEADIGYTVHCDVTAYNSVGEGAMWTEPVGPIESGSVVLYPLTLLDAFDGAAGTQLAAPWIWASTVVSGDPSTSMPVLDGAGAARSPAHPWSAAATRPILGPMDGGSSSGGLAVEFLPGTNQELEVFIIRDPPDGWERMLGQLDTATGHWRIRYQNRDGGMTEFASGDYAGPMADAAGHYGLLFTVSEYANYPGNTEFRLILVDFVTGNQTELGTAGGGMVLQGARHGGFIVNLVDPSPPDLAFSAWSAEVPANPQP